MNAWPFVMSGIVLFVGAILVGNRLLLRRERRLREGRPQQTLADFTVALAESGASEPLLRTVYEYLRARAFTREFPIDPSDNLYGVFGLEQEELGYDLPKILESAGLKWREPSADDEGVLERLSSGTVREFVLFLARLPRE